MIPLNNFGRDRPTSLWITGFSFFWGESNPTLPQSPSSATDFFNFHVAPNRGNYRQPADEFNGLMGFAKMGFHRVAFDFENGRFGWD
jgi:hypothetical protein